MVATPHYLASLAGASTLLSGGNAIDAAVAASAVLTVVYPHNTTLGGDAFSLIYMPNKGEFKGINATGRSPYAASLDYFRKNGHTRVPLTGLLPVTVPGLVDGWATLLERYGFMQFKDVLQYAIKYAREGFPVGEKLSRHIRQSVPVLSSNAGTRELFLKGGKGTEAGEILVQKDLANTLEQIKDGGRDAFYKGSIAHSIVEFSENNGGLLAEKDFEEHRTLIVEPVGTNYRGYDVYAFPPNSQGIATLIALNILEGFDLASLGQGSAELIHLMVKAKKLAFRDRDNYISDPETAKESIPIKRLLSNEHALELRSEIQTSMLESTMTSIPLQDPSSAPGSGGDTCYLCVVDKSGNSVSLIQSIYFSFGSGVIAGNTGILLQNRGAYFSLDPTHANRLEPHKRTMHTLAPAMMFRDGKPFMIFGTMGGDGQPQTQLQLVTDVVDFKMNVQEAIESPRWLHGRAMIGDRSDALNLEEGFNLEVASNLEKKGHTVVFRERWDELLGHAQAIMIGDNGVLSGGADPRGDGIAIGY